MISKETSTSGKIIHNSIWYGLETIIEVVVFLGTSIAVARYLGPTKLGYFSYINFFVALTTNASGTGLSTATRKYMSEFLALDRPGTARAVYNLACKYQLVGAITICVLGLLGISFLGDPAYKLMASILIISIVPGLMSWVPAQANQAFEDVANNTLSALGYITVYTTVIVLTIHFRWDLVGVASASLIGRTVEVFLRVIPVNRTLRKLPLDPLDPDVVYRIRRFCVQAFSLQLLMSVIWDRSEIVLLRWLSTLEQTAFYSVSFTFATNLLMLPRVFGGATGISLMVQAVKAPEQIRPIMKSASRYLLLTILPVSLGAAAVALPAIQLAYGQRYLGAGPAMMVAAILIIPRAFQALPEVLLRAGDQQGRILIWYGITGSLNVILDLILIPRYGSVGAAWGNGLSQTFGVFAIWRQARRYYEFRFPFQSAVRISLASAIMAAFAYAISHRIPGPQGLILAIVVAAIIFLLLVRVLRVLEFSDRQRLSLVGDRLPASARPAYMAVVRFLAVSAKESDAH